MGKQKKKSQVESKIVLLEAALGYRISGISIDVLNMINPKDKLNGLVLDLSKPIEFGIESQLQMGYSIRHKIVQISILADILLMDDSKKKSSDLFKLGNFQTTVDYEFLNINSYVKNKDKKQIVEMPNELLVSLVSSSYSTARGILYFHSLSTFLRGATLPLMPLDIIEKTVNQSTFTNLAP